MSSDEEEGSSRRSELRKLHHQKTMELKKVKSKVDKKSIEEKYTKLEAELLGKLPVAATPATILLPPTLYVEKDVSKSQLKKEKREASKLAHEQAVRDAVGDGSEALELKRIENDHIVRKLPESYCIREIPADGDCLFASVATQLNDGTTVPMLRNTVSDYLLEHKSEFAPFVDESECDFQEYCESIRGAKWGSDLELEAISRILERNIMVLTAESQHVFGEQFTSSDPIRLSFHQRQYTSNHYNAVVRAGR
jgi:hypothetical protein